ncbi:MAG: type II toxin-antitoxin system RelE/ParE family toxin [Bacteroidota bacterium]|nr:type II toxin-antitoxin system RelE/ParE family toxin [Bacteroidota bacterium]
MDSFKLVWKQSAIKELKNLDKTVVQRIISSVEKLQKQPYPKGCKKLRGAEYTYRLKVGNYRIIYSVYKRTLVIEIVKVGHRKSVYRNK